MSEQKDKKAERVDLAAKTAKKKTAEQPKEEKPVVVERAYAKEQLLNASKYAKQTDILSALLIDGQKYTFAEVDACIDQFLKGQV